MEFEEKVSALVAMGFKRDVAERNVRDQLGLASAFAIDGQRDDTILEKKEQVEIRKLFKAYAFDVFVFSQPRATKQTPGIPDLWLAHQRLLLAFWWESKRQVGGALSPAQVDFREACARTGTLHGSGDRYAAAQFLVDLGLAIRINDTIEPKERYVPQGMINTA